MVRAGVSLSHPLLSTFLPALTTINGGINIEDFEILAEKYRPKTLNDVVGQEHILPFFKGFAQTKKIPHMLFVGPAGVGKTSVAMALAHDIFGEDWRKSFLELNASDDRGIDVVRNKIKNYAKLVPIKYNYKIIFLDEADALTKDAQPALRRIIENTSSTCRFILSCNYPKKIIAPIVDRLVEFRFKPVKPSVMKVIIEKVITNENLKADKSTIMTLAVLSNGSLRKALSIISAFKMSNKIEITEEDIRQRVHLVDYTLIQNLVYSLIEGKIDLVDRRINDLIYNRIYDATEILSVLYNVIKESKEIPTEAKLKILPKIGDFEYRISMGASPDLQLKTLMVNIIFILKKYSEVSK